MTDNPLALRQPLFARVKELICLVFLAGNVTWQEIGCEQLGKDGRKQHNYARNPDDSFFTIAAKARRD
jgi:hypothetical protein